MMELTRLLVIVFMLVSLQFASTNGDIVVQPGYEKKSSSTVKSECPVANQPASLKLAEEIQRYHELQQTLQYQIHQLASQGYVQQVQAMPQGIVAYPLAATARTHLHPYYSNLHLHSLSPLGLHGHTIGNYGVRTLPHRFRESDLPDEQYNADPTDKTRSATGDSGLDGGRDQVHDVAAEPSVGKSKIKEIIESPVPGQGDDKIVSSPFDLIHYNQYDNQDQHHPMNFEGITSRIINTAQTMREMIDTGVPVVVDFRNDKNKNSISLMARDQDPDQSKKVQTVEDTKKLNANETSLSDEGISGKSNSEKQQNSGRTSMSSGKTLQSSKTASYDRQSQQKTASNRAMNNAMKDKIWMIAPRTLQGTTYQHQTYYQSGYHPGYQPVHQSGYQPLYQAGYQPLSQPGYQPNHQPGYQPLSQPGYQPNHQPGYQPLSHPDYQPNHQPGYQPNYQPVYQHNYEHPSIENNQPIHGNGGSSSSSYANSGPNGSTASASSSSNKNHYRIPNVGTPFVAWNPYNSPKFVDQFGRAVLTVVPSNFNPMVTEFNPNNFYGTQLASVYQQPRYWY